MKILLRLLFSFFFMLGFVILSVGQNIILQQTNENGIYKNGENINVTVLLDSMESDSISVKIIENYSEDFINQKIKYEGENQLVFNRIYNAPTSVIIEVRAKEKFASLGMVVDPASFQPGTERPKDFAKYWKKEKKALDAMPMEIRSIAVEDVEAGYLCSNVEINCTGPKPARGYFAKPDSAQPGSLPIVLIVRAAGVKGSWCQSKPEEALRYAKMGNGALAFDLNAHGMLNGQPQKYYDELEAGELKDYYFRGLENKNDNYFRGMYLRLIRTLDFLTGRPEWDGERIIVVGESQGGGQALAAAGLDKRVSAVVATVPAMCDFGGELVGGKGGWPNPFRINKDMDKMLATLPYFDAAHLLKGSGATLVTEIGFIDYTCPSNSIYAAINQSKGEKIIYGVPYRGHQLNQKEYQKLWEKTVYQPKMEFIADFLK